MLLFDNAEDIFLAHDQMLFAVNIDFRAGIFAEKNTIVDFDIERGDLAVVTGFPFPTATILPSWGFSFAVSGMMIPPLLFSSSSTRLTMTRSCKGLIFTFCLLSNSLI